MKSWKSGNVAGTGTFKCTDCDYPVSLNEVGGLPRCPNCGGSDFIRVSLFTTVETGISSAAPDDDAAEWLDDVREALQEPGQYVALRIDGENPLVYVLGREWTRIGRSMASDIRLDDPTVSRRHALIVRQPDGMRVLDDRSVNGVYVNGERVEWSTLADGDEVWIGRFRLHFVDLPAFADKEGMGSPSSLLHGRRDPLRREWTELIGPLLSREQILDAGPHGTVATRVATGSLLSVEDGDDELFPAFQIDPETGAPFSELSQLIPLFRDARVDDYSAASWFRSAHPLLDGETPAEWLAQHRDTDALLEAARRTVARFAR